MKAKYIYAGLIPKDAENEITLTAVPRASLTDFSEISELALDILAGSQAEERKKEVERQKEKTREQKEKILAKAREDAKQLYVQAKEEADRIIKEMNKQAKEAINRTKALEQRQ